MTTASATTRPPVAPPRPRKTRSYLIDPRFQLKYTAMLVGVVLAVMLALGAVIYRTANTAASTAQYAALQAERAVRESQTASRVTRMSEMMNQTDPEALGTLERTLADVDAQAARELDAVRDRSAAIEAHRRALTRLLLAAAAALVAVLGAMGVYITRRIVGPVHKMKRLLRQVSTGRLVVKERLRRGDELGDLFETFLQMTHSLTALQVGRLKTLDAAIARAEADGGSPELVAGLRALRAQMCLGLVGHDRRSIRPPTTPAGDAR